MAPGVILLEEHPSPDLESSHTAKRQKVKHTTDTATSIFPHPLRIKPLGNAFTSDCNLRDTSLGRFAMLPDELVVQVLGWLNAQSLLKLGATSKGFYAFSQFEELWKDLFVQCYHQRPSFTWHGTWRSTFLSRPPSLNSRRISCHNLFSDVLYRPFYCSQINLSKYTSNIPISNLITVLPDLSLEEFNTKWASQPFIMTEPVKSWPGYQQWTIDSLVAKYGDVKFRAEAVDWPLSTYAEYMSNNTDESPLYLFDKWFCEKTSMGKEYTVPPVFAEDFFSVLADERPDRMWVILGPERSGSTFHKDPNATSAWNAVVQGEKYWIMFPKEITPPGVFVSDDQSEVTSPLSIAEWFEGFHKEARKMKGVKEGICSAGEVLHVPSGWWHLVVNLSPALAITQNFVPRKHLSSALLFLRDQRQSISGFDCSKVQDPYGLFVSRLQEKYPEALAQALSEMDTIDAGVAKKRGGKWDALIQDAKKEKENGGGGFTFNFGAGNEDSSENEDEHDGPEAN